MKELKPDLVTNNQELKRVNYRNVLPISKANIFCFIPALRKD
jgi:hypothetical protein